MDTEQATVLTYLDAYCERAGDPGLWGEPLNAASNLLFLLAAFAALWLVAKRRDHRFAHIPDLWLLIVALTGISIGSGLWHLVPTGHTVLMDVLPITAFINIYLVAALRRFFGLGWLKVAALWGLYTGLGVAAQLHLPADLLNGTIMYIPTYLTLVAITLALRRVDAAAGQVLTRIVLVWTLSLAFRTADLEICEHFPLGTHFLWHALNAWVLYRLFAVLSARAA